MRQHSAVMHGMAIGEPDSYDSDFQPENFKSCTGTVMLATAIYS